MEHFFWFDCFAIDEHAAQNFTPEWWDTTFKEAIGKIGHTVMILLPWDDPTPLKRAWCLWELLCTFQKKADFSVCFGPTQLAAFEEVLKADAFRC
eukprot:SAG22_NODE_5784_length_953_cov_1.014052_2_plen_95_part_00